MLECVGAALPLRVTLVKRAIVAQAKDVGTEDGGAAARHHAVLGRVCRDGREESEEQVEEVARRSWQGAEEADAAVERVRRGWRESATVASVNGSLLCSIVFHCAYVCHGRKPCAPCSLTRRARTHLRNDAMASGGARCSSSAQVSRSSR